MKTQKYLLLFLIFLLLILPFQAVNHIHSTMDSKDDCMACKWIQIFSAVFIFLILFFEIIFLFKPLCLRELTHENIFYSTVYSIRGPPEN